MPTAVANVVPLRQLVTLTGCDAEPGGWRAAGAASNPTSKAVTYTITVFFTTDQATVETFGKTTVTLPAQKSTAWTLPVLFAADPSTLCVLRAVS